MLELQPISYPEACRFISKYHRHHLPVTDDWACVTTIVACQNLGRKCRAIEVSPAYCAVTLERMATAFPGIEIARIE